MRVIKPEPYHVHEWTSLIDRFLAEGIDHFGFGIRQEDVETTFFLWVNRNLPLLLLEDEGKIIGCLGGNLFPHWFNYDTLIFNEMIWYVLPEYRRGGGGVRLIRAMEKECKDRGVDKMVLGHTYALMPDDLRKLFEGLGYRIIESHYIKDIKNANT